MIKINMIWIPYIIFQNTDDDEAVKVDALTEDGTMRTEVSIKRENNFTRSGPEVADEVENHCIVHYHTCLDYIFLNRLRYSRVGRTL